MCRHCDCNEAIAERCVRPRLWTIDISHRTGHCVLITKHNNHKPSPTSWNYGQAAVFYSTTRDIMLMINLLRDSLTCASLNRATTRRSQPRAPDSIQQSKLANKIVWCVNDFASYGRTETNVHAIQLDSSMHVALCCSSLLICFCTQIYTFIRRLWGAEMPQPVAQSQSHSLSRWIYCTTPCELCWPSAIFNWSGPVNTDGDSIRYSSDSILCVAIIMAAHKSHTTTCITSSAVWKSKPHCGIDFTLWEKKWTNKALLCVYVGVRVVCVRVSKWCVCVYVAYLDNNNIMYHLQSVNM